MSEAKLGTIPNETDKRDAIHVAIIPLVAITDLQPGQRLKSGIVDPFRQGTIKRGERYYLCLYPGSVTSMRHVWSAPTISDEPEDPSEWTTRPPWQEIIERLQAGEGIRSALGYKEPMPPESVAPNCKSCNGLGYQRTNGKPHVCEICNGTGIDQEGGIL